jgi:prevent-host-death family protein
MILMKKQVISVTEAARNFAECVNRAHYQDVTFVLTRNGEPIARITPDRQKHCTAKELAEALAEVDLSAEDAKAWYKDLQQARKNLRPAEDKWR